jgi:hypothetical protein
MTPSIKSAYVSPSQLCVSDNLVAHQPCLFLSSWMLLVATYYIGHVRLDSSTVSVCYYRAFNLQPYAKMDHERNAKGGADITFSGL